MESSSPVGLSRHRSDPQCLSPRLSERRGLPAVESLRRAGLEGLDEYDVVRSEIIEWRGGGPDVWAEPPP